MIRRTARGGSVVGFVAACLVGAVLLVGSVYAVRHAGWFQNGTVATTSNPSDKTSDSASKSSNSSSKSNGGTSTNKSSSNGAGSSSKSSTSEGSSASGTANSSTSQNDGNQPATNLPTTGPADVVASLFAVGSLTMALTAYIRSRRIA